MELAGLVLGGLPIALVAMDNYHRCLQATRDYWRYESTIKLLRNHIFLQQEQLHKTLRDIGLTDPSPVRLQEFMRQKYPGKYEVFVDIIAHMDGLLEKLMDTLDVDIDGKPRWTKEPPARANWEWRRVKRGFGRSSRQRLIDDLQKWNTALRACFEKSEVPLNFDVPCSTLETIRTKFNPQWCNEIRRQASQVHDAVAKSWQCQCRAHQANLKLLWHEDQLLKPPSEFHVAVCSTKDPSGDVKWQELLFEQIKDSTSQEPGSPPQTLELSIRPRKPSKAWFRPYFDLNDQQLEMGQSSSLSSNQRRPFDTNIPLSTGHVTVEEGPPVKPREIRHRPDTDCLCSFLHEKDEHARVLVPVTGQCLRIRKNLERPPLTTTVIPIRTILASKTCQRLDAMPLSRRDRFSLAAAATWAWDAKPELYLLSEHHSCTWRHYPSLSSILQKSLHPEASSAVDEKLEPSDPFPTLVHNKTLFALGVLLIELCLGKPFEQLRREYHYGSLSAAFGMGIPVNDYEIANQYVDKVYLEAGDFYGHAVQRCIRCEFPGRDITKNFQFEQFRRDFFSYVIAPVQTTYALLPSSVASL
ncbi:hypothetical protein PG987_009016 [Apiospora arundinis]